MSHAVKLFLLAICVLQSACFSNPPRESGGFMGDTLLRVCIFTERRCKVEVISAPGDKQIFSEMVSEPVVLQKLNPPINLEQELQVFSDCGDGTGRVLHAHAAISDVFTPGMCVRVDLR